MAGFIRIGQAFGKADAFGELETVGEYSREQVVRRFARMLSHAQVQRLVDPAIGVRQVDIECVDGCSERQVPSWRIYARGNTDSFGRRAGYGEAAADTVSREGRVPSSSGTSTSVK
jgi:hypothetical protein